MKYSDKPPTQNTPKVLIVEDDIFFANLYEQKIRSIAQETTVTHASNGYAALERILESAPDAVVLDMNMPNLDGCEFLHIVKSKPDFHKIPVIVISSSTNEYSEIENLFPNTFFFQKPITDKLFRVIVSNALLLTPVRITSTPEESFHKTHLDRYLGNNAKTQLELVRVFYDHTPDRIVELDNHYRQGNNRLMLDWCHGMKSTAAVFGAHKLVTYINELVDILATPESSNLDKHIKLVIDEVRATAVKLHLLFPSCTNY